VQQRGILQGIGGGGMVPVAQSILADSFPAGEARPGVRAVTLGGCGGTVAMQG
jgi:MFS family permease